MRPGARALGIATNFDASHFLPNHEGKCANLHGHTWHLEIEVIGHIQDDGMVIDLSILKKAVKNVTDQLDHNNINTIVDFSPTCEQLIYFLKNALQKELKPYRDIEIYSIKLKEGEGGWAKWTID